MRLRKRSALRSACWSARADPADPPSELRLHPSPPCALAFAIASLRAFHCSNLSWASISVRSTDDRGSSSRHLDLSAQATERSPEKVAYPLGRRSDEPSRLLGYTHRIAWVHIQPAGWQRRNGQKREPQKKPARHDSDPYCAEFTFGLRKSGSVRPEFEGNVPCQTLPVAVSSTKACVSVAHIENLPGCSGREELVPSGPCTSRGEKSFQDFQIGLCARVQFPVLCTSF